MPPELTERIWQRIKDTAQHNAGEGLLLSRADSERAVNSIVLSIDGPIPQRVLEFYARELVRLTDEAKEQNSH